VVTPAAHREAAAYLQSTYEMSQRRACRVNETLFRSLPRAVLEAWRRDYNEARPHSKLGWMTPLDYARALCGEPGGTLRNLMAPRAGLLQPTTTTDQINPRLSLSLDEKRGSGHELHRIWIRGCLR
jgi:hypothetical protein